jgi:twitching motility protein PilU
MDLAPYLKLVVEKNASDLFLTADSPVKIKLEGKAVSVGKSELTPELTQAAAEGIMNDRQKAEFADTNECDFAIAMPDGSARFRVNVFRQRGRAAMVLRLIPTEIPTLEGLRLPEVLGE